MSSTAKAYLSVLFLCIVWGTTFIAIRIGVMEFPPFLFAAIRQSCAGLLLGIGLYAMGKKLDWSKINIWHQLVPGVLMIGMGNGLISWAAQFIPSGLAALISAMMPVCVVLINLVVAKDQRFNRWIVGGLALGVVGMLLVFKDSVAALANRDYLNGILLTLCATFSWALGSVYAKKKRTEIDPFYAASLQLFLGGVVLFIMSLFFDNWSAIPYMSLQGFGALLYLIVFGSIAAFMAYLYALSILPIGVVSIYAYVNPLVAIVLGVLVMQEKLTVYTSLAFIVTLAGVYLINTGYKLQAK